MNDDFIYEEEVDSAGSSSRRPFLVAVGVLLTIFVLAVICSATLLLTRGDGADGSAEEIAAIETQNAIVAVTNEAVTQTIAAMETEAARPTDTPQPPPTNTPRPTNTPLPTNTPVVSAAEHEMTATTTPDVPATGTAAAVAEEDTPTPIAALNGGSGGDDSLPQTGIETWGMLVVALGLIAAFWGARRLRSS